VRPAGARCSSAAGTGGRLPWHSRPGHHPRTRRLTRRRLGWPPVPHPVPDGAAVSWPVAVGYDRANEYDNQQDAGCDPGNEHGPPDSLLRVRGGGCKYGAPRYAGGRLDMESRLLSGTTDSLL